MLVDGLDLLEHLEFDFKKAIQKETLNHEKWCNYRTRFHENQRLLSRYFIHLVNVMARIFELLPGEKRLKVAILSPDIIPETSEALAALIMEEMAKDPALPTPDLLSRRKTLNQKSLTFSYLPDWRDAEVCHIFQIQFGIWN